MTQEKLQMGAHAKKSMDCAQCNAKIPVGEHYTFEGEDKSDVFLCKSCHGEMNKLLEEEIKNPRLWGAVALGVVAAIAGGALWYVIVILTKTEFGYAAIGLGYLIGLGVYLGAGKKRGPILQFTSAALALLALIISEFFVLGYFLKQFIVEEGGVIEGSFTPRLLSMVLEDPSIYYESVVSPIGLLIWGIALYIAFSVPKAKKV